MKDFAVWLLEGLGATERQIWDRITVDEEHPAKRLNTYHAVELHLLYQARTLETLLRYVDQKGYTLFAVRALFEFHWTALCSADVGSDAHSAYVDLTVATSVATTSTREVVGLLRDGYSVKFIGTVFGKNGSRVVSRACRELSNVLEGA